MSNFFRCAGCFAKRKAADDPNVDKERWRRGREGASVQGVGVAASEGVWRLGRWCSCRWKGLAEVGERL